MDRYQRAAFLDFFSTVIWATRTVLIATANQTVFPILGTWDTAHDLPMAWVNGNRVSGAITWVDDHTVQLPTGVAAGKQVVVLVSPGAGTGYLPRTGLAAMLGALDMGGFRVKNAGASIEADDLVRRDEVENIVSVLLGGNYLLLTGGQMEGVLLLAAASADPASAVRRNMVALLDGSQPFTGKQAGVATVDGDPDGTLTTKGWVSGKINTDLATLRFPSRSWVRTVAGDYTVAIPAGVTQVYAHLRGGDGGGGGVAGTVVGSNHGGNGGKGGRALVVIPIDPAGETLSIKVAGGGQHGGNGVTGGTHIGGGGGGGGGSVITAVAGIVTAGGGGGGGGNGQFGWTGGAGGSGGSPGASGDAGYAAAAGNNVTTGGGAGGAGGSSTSGTNGNDGSVSNPASLADAPGFIAAPVNVQINSEAAPGIGATSTTVATDGRAGIIELFW